MLLNALRKSMSSKALRDFGRHVRNFNYEMGGGELMIAKAKVRGDIALTINGQPAGFEHNGWTTEGANHALNVVLHGDAATGTWYIAPFGGNVAFADTWTAANFNSNTTELSTEYSEATRVAYVETAAASKSINNTAAPAVITAAEDNVSIWGFGLLSVSTKQSTSGVLLAATKYSTVRTLATTSDTLGITYVVSLSN